MTEQGVTNLAFENGSESKNGIAKTNHAQNLNSPPSKFDVNEHSTNIPEIKVEERAVWGNSLEFLMSCISMSVGLGNIWRFPFTAYENGGGAFLIPYIIVLILIGKPIYYLEMYLGQFTSRSACKMWNLSPAFKGVGYGQLLAVFSIVSYYTSIIALTFYYLFVSFSTELPWSKCRPEWGSDCVDSQPNATTLHISTENKSISSSENYFLHDVLKETSDISDGIGLPDWQLTLCLLLSWTIIYLIIIRGVKSSGKAAYFLAIFPYIVILMLLIRAVTLEGAVDGILFFVRPQWDQLLNPKVWYAATTQVFFSLSVGMGTIVMFASYNHFPHNIYRDAMIVTTLDTFTSAIAGITIFGILGNLAHNLGVSNIDEVVRSGAGLAFISYPDAISKFDVVPQLFAVLFFIMLSVLGVGSVVALQNSIVTVICDKWRSLKYWAVAFGACLAGFLIGLIYVTPGGQWMLNLVDHFGGTFMVFALAIFEIIGVVWVYGLENVCWDLEFMTGTKVSLYWRICWAILTPGLMIIIFVYSMVNLEPLTYSKWEYPDIATAFGWILFSIGLLQVPVWAIWKMAHNKNMSNYQKVRTSFHPNDKWGPANATTRKEWIAFKEEAVQRKLNQSYNHPLWKRKLFVLLGRYK